MKTHTDEELEIILETLNNFKSPWFSKIIFKLWFNVIKFSIIPMFIIIMVLMIIYNNMGNWNPNIIYVWNTVKGLGLFWIGWGLLMTIAHLAERTKMRVTAKKIGLTIKEWDYYMNLYQIQRKH